MSAARTPTLDARGGRCACEWVGDKLKVVCIAHLEAVRAVYGNKPSDAFRVFCPKHDAHEARYHRDRPMTDDSCPRCARDALVAALLTVRDEPGFEAQHGTDFARHVDLLLKAAKGEA